MSEHSAAGGAVSLAHRAGAGVPGGSSQGGVTDVAKGFANRITEVVRYGYPEMQAGIAVDQLASAIGIPNEDAALVAELQAGSEQAFAQLIDRYHQPLYSLIARSLQDPADASDIAQEVFIKVFRSIGSFHGEASLRTWLYRIALREASNQRRWWSRHKRQEVAIDAPGCASCDADGEGDSLPIGAALADGGCSPFEFAAQTEVRERVEAALREVPEAFRTVVVLREIEGFTYEEIAEILQVNLGTVKSRLTRGRAILRGLLAPADEARKPVVTAHAKVARFVVGAGLGVSR